MIITIPITIVYCILFVLYCKNIQNCILLDLDQINVKYFILCALDLTRKDLENKKKKTIISYALLSLDTSSLSYTSERLISTVNEGKKA